MPFLSPIGLSPLNITRAGASGDAVQLLLDLYPNAAAAYSLRKLRVGYTGDAIRVRIDTTGQPEYNIGFVNNELDVATLEGYCTGGLDAFVITWYDQSGNGYNATQATVSRQPQIVSSGVVNTSGLKPTISTDGSNALSSNTFNLSQPLTFFLVSKINNVVNNNYFYDSNNVNNRNITYVNSIGNYSLFSGGSPADGSIATTNRTLLTSIFNTPNSYLYVNGNLDINNQSVGTETLQGLTIASSYDEIKNQITADFQELIIYNSNQSSNRVEIETNINDYYNIYPETYNFEQALEFDGVDDFADLPLIESQNFSMSFWINVNDTDTHVILGESSAGYFFALFSQSDRNRFNLINATSNVNYNYTTPLNIGDWNHVFFSYNSGASNLYLNGVATAKDGNNTGDFSWLYLGQRSSGAPFLDGKLDDLVVWDGVTGTAQNAIDLYNGGAGADPTTVIPNPNRWYKFNNNLNDSGSDGQNLTLNNFSANPYVPHT